MNHRGEFGVHIGTDRRDVGGVALQSGEGGLGVVLAHEGHAPGEAFVQDEPE